MIYVHLPFCKRFCAYCDFHSATRLQDMQPMLRAILKEWEAEWPAFAPLHPPERPHTLYVGGGTPSLYPPQDLRLLVEKFYATAAAAETEPRKQGHKQGPGQGSGQSPEPTPEPTPELTLEANPNDLSAAYCRDLRAAGFNRLSIGIQAFQDRHLRAMGRRHNVREAYQSVENARAAGFDNLSLDLILGFPGLQMSEWEESLQAVLRLRPEHLSAYQLSLEPATPWGRAVEAGTLVPLPEEEALCQYWRLQEVMAQAGYVQYELSNFALPGHASVHNSAYWDEVPYLGLGAGAHSYTGSRRWANVADNAAYLRGMAQGRPLREEEDLSPTDRYNERVMLGLRRARGLDPEAVVRDFPAQAAGFRAGVAQLQAQGFLHMADGRLSLPPRHYFIADSLIRELFALDPSEE